jgi:hypothetical protein
MMNRDELGQFIEAAREQAEKRRQEQRTARAEFLAKIIQDSEPPERGTFTQEGDNDGNKS